MQGCRSVVCADMLQRLTTFVRIAESGSISRAARSLHLSVPMASRHLRRLEDDLGVTLVKRTTRRIELTDAGTEMLERARAILLAMEEASEAVRPGRGVVGRVVVSTQPALGRFRIVPLVAQLLDEHPRLRIDLHFSDRPVDLLADGVDLAIRAGARPQDGASTIVRHLCDYDLVVCASAPRSDDAGPGSQEQVPSGHEDGTGVPEDAS
jgi:LysR family transcriptional regulator for bpeEF and oprC